MSATAWGLASRVDCPHCKAETGHPCVVDGEPLTWAPAHISRIREAEKAA